jgi:hypothetical protein
VKRCQYRWYFALRSTAEILKVWIIVGMILEKSLFFDVPDLRSGIFMEFIIYMSVTCLMSMVTFYLSIRSMSRALNERR